MSLLELLSFIDLMHIPSIFFLLFLFVYDEDIGFPPTDTTEHRRNDIIVNQIKHTTSDQRERERTRMVMMKGVGYPFALCITLSVCLSVFLCRTVSLVLLPIKLSFMSWMISMSRQTSPHPCPVIGCYWGMG